LSNSVDQIGWLFVLPLGTLKKFIVSGWSIGCANENWSTVITHNELLLFKKKVGSKLIGPDE
jgi:hypothetical protein